jgi:hypothetical protein
MSTMAGNITVLTPSLRTNACERLLISSEVHPKWKNSNTWEKFRMTFNSTYGLATRNVQTPNYSQPED